MTSSFEHVLTQAKALPLEERQRLWAALRDDLQAARSAALEEMRAKYRDSVLRVDNFLADKHEDIEREERRSRMREFRQRYRGMFSNLEEFVAEKQAEVEREEQEWEERLKLQATGP